MPDFDLTPLDREVLEMVNAQSRIARTYARRLDHRGAHSVFGDLPEAASLPDPRRIAAERTAESSGAAVLDIMVYLEELWGTVIFRKSGNESTFLGSKLVKALGTDEQYERWGKAGLAIALTEPGAGSDPSRIRTTAEWDQATQEWVLNGEKIFISLADSSDGAVVFALAKTAEGIVPGIFVVEKGTPGFTVGPQLEKLGQRSWDTASLIFQDCRLSADCRLLGDMRNMLQPLNVSRPWVAAAALAFSRAALDLAREWLESQGQAPDYRFDAREPAWRTDRFEELEALYEASWLNLIHAKWHEDTTGADKLEAAICKAQSGGAARRIIAGCMELLGAEAASEQHLLEMWLRDSRVADIYEGAGEVNRLIIARELLSYSPKELA